MKQISKHSVNKLTVVELKALLPFQITSDGEVVAVVLPVHDVNKLGKASHDVNRVTKPMAELPFSKKAQASGRLGRID